LTLKRWKTVEVLLLEQPVVVSASFVLNDLKKEVFKHLKHLEDIPSVEEMVLARRVGGGFEKLSEQPNLATVGENVLFVLSNETWINAEDAVDRLEDDRFEDDSDHEHFLRHMYAGQKTISCGEYLFVQGGCLMTMGNNICWRETTYRNGSPGLVVADRFLKGNLDWVRLLFDNSVPMLQILLWNLHLDKRTKSSIEVKSFRISVPDFFASPSRFDFGVLLSQVKHAGMSWPAEFGVVVKATYHDVYSRVNSALRSKSSGQKDLVSAIAMAFARNKRPSWASTKEISDFVGRLVKGENVAIERICDVLLTFARLFMAHQVYLDPDIAELVRSEHLVRMYFAMILDCCDGLKRHVRKECKKYNLLVQQMRCLMDDFNEFAAFGHRFRGPAYKRGTEPSSEDALKVLDELRACVTVGDVATIQHVVHLGYRIVNRPSQIKEPDHPNKKVVEVAVASIDEKIPRESRREERVPSSAPSGKSRGVCIFGGCDQPHCSACN